ncbi:MAG TPA: ATP-dependent helicase C-terminal domain-containing protein, partial [Polyangiaceae bacterium]|nr:ATP-dependent helicase C-terminal domain-containing protein [Polyangiaceae bacterium]
ASAADENLLLELYADKIGMSDELVFDVDRERIERVERMSFGSIVLEESRTAAAAGPESARLLLEAARARAHEFVQSDSLALLAARLELALRYFPDSGLPADPGAAVIRALEFACRDATSLAALRAQDLAELLLASLGESERRLLEAQFPERVRLPGGRSVVVHYETGKAPWIESRLQDYFGLQEGPRIAGGQLALTLHLLAPNQRAVQVTSDLAGFWQRHYPGIRKELMRRYPRHAWPEDASRASPPPPNPRR